MKSKCFFSLRTIGLLLCLGMSSIELSGQLNERPNDPLGLSIREPYVQVIHSDEPTVAGSSMYLQQTDPWLTYKMGSSYFQREWNKHEGVFSELMPGDPSGTANSCAMCHNQPFRSAGAGGNTLESVGVNRNTPHLFGVGLIETIGIQIRQQIMAKYDLNKNGFLDAPKEIRKKRAIIEASPGVEIDFGPLDDLDGDGKPDLNEVLLVKFVDKFGRARTYDDEGERTKLRSKVVAGYDLAVGILSSSKSDHQFPSLRLFTTGVLQSIMGFRVVDNTVSNDAGVGRDLNAFDGWSEVSNAGAPQIYFPLSRSRGSTNFLSEGDLDLFEWFLMNHPKPALGKQDENTIRGQELMKDLGCNSCHVPDWSIQAEDKELGYPGDRRFFDLEVTYDTLSEQLAGKLNPLSKKIPGENGNELEVPRKGSYQVKNIFSDFKYYDLGSRFYEYTYRDSKIDTTRKFRTAPLWGLGSSAPYGHDGHSPTIDEVITRHGGEAQASADAYAAISAEEKAALLAFLNSLVLYQPDVLPTDINGDDRIDAAFKIADQELGPERFQTELLFKVLPQYKGWTTNIDGEKYFSYEILNLDAAYRRTLDALMDFDEDCIPDLTDPQPGN